MAPSPKPRIEPDRRNAERLDPHGPANLAVETADRPQHAELPPPIGNRDGERVHDAQNRDQHGNGNCTDVRLNH